MTEKYYRPAGYHMTPEQGDWPVGPKHDFTAEQVIAALNVAITAEKWEAAKKSLRETPDNWADKKEVIPIDQLTGTK